MNVKPEFIRCLDCVEYVCDNTCKAKKHYHISDEKVFTFCTNGSISLEKIIELQAKMEVTLMSTPMTDSDKVNMFKKMKKYYFIFLYKVEGTNKTENTHREDFFTFDMEIFTEYCKNYFNKEKGIFPHCQVCKNARKQEDWNDYFVPNYNCGKCEHYPYKSKEPTIFEQVDDLKARLEVLDGLCLFCKDIKTTTINKPCFECRQNPLDDEELQELKEEFKKQGDNSNA